MSQRKKVLGIGAPRFATEEFTALKAVADIHWFVPDGHPQVIREVKRLCEEHGPFDAAYVLFGTARYGPFTEEMLRPLFPGCGLFASGGAGYDDIPTKFLAENGAYAANTPTAVTNATADMALFLTLAVLRNTSQVEANCRAGRWRDDLELNEDPFGKTFGIFGMGKIAKATAKKVQGTGMKEEKSLDVSYVTEDELLASSDVLSLHCPLTPETREWFNAERIAKLKHGAFFVNTARGAIVDEAALIQALESGKIKRAGLDVFVGEPNPNPWFLQSNQVTVQPHWGAFTTGTIYVGECQVLDNVRTFLETGRPRYPVNKPKGTEA
ncbi:D-isomer specific 2-hydroxyacid dehydrogenase [Desarmillaria tabescens]|uniref:D-isomer specific 2-hydroxyacid dehydrogenase n=1 Tax=Armillaria tabescens TaxID=1929756 RepID=A0AA39N9T2_ARMTA|nr:D-isomer specific 2-hydroxyacid dehydrogenase [Desarmillaria tabescens]KAK0461676.1 D-isomer specific 2-hydroxyacid dehydrogenase [Desarmillaria tabescens]